MKDHQPFVCQVYIWAQDGVSVPWQNVSAHAMGPGKLPLHLRRALDDSAPAVVCASAAALLACIQAGSSEEAYHWASLCPRTGAGLLELALELACASLWLMTTLRACQAGAGVSLAPSEHSPFRTASGGQDYSIGGLCKL